MGDHDAPDECEGVDLEHAAADANTGTIYDRAADL